jgi:hypothetical protein
MQLPGQRVQDKLSKIKKTIKRSYDYFKPNYDRYNDFRRFVFDTNLTDDDVSLLTSLGRPTLEFNILEAYISRLLGEFSKQEPSIEVSADDPERADPNMIRMIEEHLRHTFNDANNEHTKYEVYKDLLSGGFSVLKVFADYESKMSMKQDIFIERVFDPTLTYFDELANLSHKGDGRFCGELRPMSKEDFEEEYPDIDLSGVTFKRDFQGFNWSYLNDNSEILMVAEHYEKRPKEIRIVQVRDGRVMPLHEYEHMLATWSDLTAPPTIIGKPRKTTIDHVYRYRLIENTVLEYEETEFNSLPLVFVDGNSVMIKAPKNGNVRQMTRPYVYHAKGAQRLKNFAGISLANAIENEVQHKFMVAKEAIPKEEGFLQAYKDVQKASVLIYNSVHENNPEMPILNPIQPVPKIPAPPEIMQAWTGVDSIIQMELGSYDAQLGINNNQLSGIAVVEAASQSNAAAMPYIVGFMQGLQRAAQIYVDMIPKYWVTPRTMPLLSEKGHRYFVPVNQNNRPTFDYGEDVLNVCIKAGASFQVQKSRTIMMVKEMMGMSPLFAQFIAEKGLDFVLDNMEGRGVEQLKEMVDGWLKEMQQQKQVAMQQQQAEAAQNPVAMRAQVETQKLNLEKEKMMLAHKIDMLKLELEHNKLDADINMSHRKDAMEIHKAELDHSARFTDTVIKAHDVVHKHLDKVEKHD